jgi:polyisoprenyl-teichoic acid--peptidoglycan teichoic acid transferase
MSNLFKKSGRKIDGPASIPSPYLATPQEAPVAPPLTVTPAKPAFEYKRKVKKPHTWRRRILIGLAGLAILTVAFFAIKAFLTTHRIISRNNTGSALALNDGKCDPNRVKKEGDCRINILLLGIGGAGHEGPNLTDTVMVMSIDPKTKDVAMLSLPRDMWVPIPNNGNGKINAAHALGESKKKDEGPVLAKTTVTNVLDFPIHYFIRIDFNGFKKAIDTVGGIDVYVEKPLNDPEYPCDKNPGRACGFSLKAGQTHMNGELALKYVRCRKGTCGNDFGRAQRQQQVLLALRQKAMSASTFTNPAKISGLMDALGTGLKTDLQLHEIKQLADLMGQIDTTKVTSKVLDTSSDAANGGLLKDANYGGYVEIPKAGLNNFTDIRAFAHTIFPDAYIKEEAAAILIQNGTNKTGLANTVSKLLTGYNYNVISATTADRTDYKVTELYDYTDGKKPYTIKYLELRFKVKAKRVSRGDSDPDIKLIVGADYKP